jgi:hypothetical protein
MNKKQLLITAAVIAVLAIIYWLTGSGREVQKSIDGDAFQLDSIAVASLSLVNGNDTITFQRGSEGWMLDNYPVRKSSFDRLLETALQLKPDRFVSQKAEKYAEYGVDSTAPTLILRDEKGDMRKQFHLGNSASTGNETFIRVPGDAKVYTALERLSSYRNITRENYWDNKIVDLEPADLYAVSINGDINFAMEQKNMGWTFNGQLTDPRKSENFLRNLGRQTASKVARAEIPEMAMLLATLTLTPDDGAPITLKYFENETASTTVFVKRSGNDMRFEMFKSSFDNFNKTYADLEAEEQPANAAGQAQFENME